MGQEFVKRGEAGHGSAEGKGVPDTIYGKKR